MYLGQLATTMACWDAAAKHFDDAVRLATEKGLHYIHYLLEHPGQEFHAIYLASLVERSDQDPARRRGVARDRGMSYFVRTPRYAPHAPTSPAYRFASTRVICPMWWRSCTTQLASS